MNYSSQGLLTSKPIILFDRSKTFLILVQIEEAYAKQLVPND